MNIQFSWTEEKAKSNEQFLNLPNCFLLIDPYEENAQDLAIFLGKINLCKEKKVCGTCQGCNLLKADTHPDFLFFPEPLKIDEVRTLLEKIALTPSISKERIIFLGKIDQYLPAAINALLKTLEEPPMANHFILSAKAKRAVMPTILSRSQVFNVEPPSSEESKNYLISQGFSENEAKKALEIYRNNPFLALKNKDLPNPYDFLEDFQKYCQSPQENHSFFKRLREIPEKEKVDVLIKLCEKTVLDIQVEGKNLAKINLISLHGLLAAFYRLKRPYLRQINQNYAVNDLIFKYLEERITL